MRFAQNDEPSPVTRSQHSEQAYRADIDGLRAVAVTSVLLFHAFPQRLPGGFVGVDVFFVISGYLISKILVTEIRDRRFSLWRFYQRRIKRILPALLLVLFTCLAVGWYLLLPGEFVQMSRHAVWGLLSAGNFKNLRGTYFDNAGDLAPLWHLWSLGVEEQFYLAWPLILWLGFSGKNPRRRLLSLVALLILLSFALNIGLVGSRPTLAFYLPFTRTWQLAAGAFLACWQVSSAQPGSSPAVAPSGAVANVSSVLGLGLVVASLALIDSSRAFPGFWALLPTAAAGLTIAAGPNALLNRAVLGSRPCVWIGLISYPLYLWHWPVLSFARILAPRPIPTWSYVGLLLLATLLAWLTYRFVETPIRASRVGARPVWLLLGGTAGLTAGAEACFVGLVPKHLRPTAELVRRGYARDSELRAAYVDQPCDGVLPVGPHVREYCRILPSQPGAPTLALWGDSHAFIWSPVLFGLAQRLGYRVVLIGHSGCPPLLHVRRTDPGVPPACRDFALAEEAVATIAAAKPSRIYLAARWNMYAYGWKLRSSVQTFTNFITASADGSANEATSLVALRRQFFPTVEALRDIAPLTLIRTPPTLSLPYEAGEARDPERFEPTLVEHRQLEAFPDALIDDAARRLDSIRVVDPATVLCRQRCMATLDGQLLYFDDNHLTVQGAQLFAAQLAPGG